ncbi:hypothetical protein FE257_007927 [Aspergillus nanangensis]|uniref:Carboxypeptidase n=1 Tax=Aspergillus nanangensis TaxID=2582783 RepID=A0AAD4CXA8_ASPNN|nr:hypothetical protein FE257_007927 [Aspergillus nanangensis]
MLIPYCVLSLLATAASARSPYHTAKTEGFAVNGSAIPDIDFDIGESYAGYLDNSPSGDSSLYFWFFPTTNPNATDEITIWLSGCPGCSSLLSLIQETGPFLWKPGTYKPTRNPYSWNNLTNIVYVDQPAGTGFSLGPPTVHDEEDVAREFMDFWVRFMQTFALQDRKVYITGESWAGVYIPYIASAMLDKENSTYFDVKGVHLIDPVINSMEMSTDASALSMVQRNQPLFALNHTFMTDITHRASQCGYTDLMNLALQFPPPQDSPPLPPPPSNQFPNCSIWESITSAARLLNPCFNPYNIRDYCPYPWNVMNFPSSSAGPHNYFNRSDVQKAINAYPTDYSACGADNSAPIFGDNGDPSPPSSFTKLPSVVERTNNTIVAHGALDFALVAEGTLATIQNMSWNGARGFQREPEGALFVPYLGGGGYPAAGDDMDMSSLRMDWISGAGEVGVAHTERGLTFTLVFLAGHQMPQYTPGAAYRQLELLLGRIGDLSTPVETFSTGGGP